LLLFFRVGEPGAHDVLNAGLPTRPSCATQHDPAKRDILLKRGRAI
jgi:hypothetical protein